MNQIVQITNNTTNSSFLECDPTNPTLHETIEKTTSNNLTNIMETSNDLNNFIVGEQSIVGNEGILKLTKNIFV